MRLVLLSSLAWITPATLRAEAASQHLARELICLALVAGATACLLLLSALSLVTARDRDGTQPSR